MGFEFIKVLCFLIIYYNFVIYYNFIRIFKWYIIIVSFRFLVEYRVYVIEDILGVVFLLFIFKEVVFGMYYRVVVGIFMIA